MQTNARKIETSFIMKYPSIEHSEGTNECQSTALVIPISLFSSDMFFVEFGLIAGKISKSET